MYVIETTSNFDRNYKKLVKRNHELDKYIRRSLSRFQVDPFLHSLNTHEVESSNFGKTYSSRVTGDLRILWRFDIANGSIILLLTIGGHSGGRKVYR